jgi:hypothetical protein
MQVLLYQLLYISNPTEPLPIVIKKFDKSFSHLLFDKKDPMPILWVLIKFYGYFFDESDISNAEHYSSLIKQLETF